MRCSAPAPLFGDCSREQQIANLKFAILTCITEPVNLLSRQANQDEVQAYRQMVMDVAEKAANAFRRILQEQWAAHPSDSNRIHSDFLLIDKLSVINKGSTSKSMPSYNWK